MIFAPRGTVIISAKTSPESISTSVNLSTISDTDVDKSILKAVNVTDKKETSIDLLQVVSVKKAIKHTVR